MRNVLYARYLIVSDIEHSKFRLDDKEEVSIKGVGDEGGRKTDILLKAFYLRDAIMTKVNFFEIL